MTVASPGLVLSCEHGGNRVPARYAGAFRSTAARAALSSHRGWDPGALAVARVAETTLGAPLYYSTTSRLLIDTNRSLHHRNLFSEFTRGLPPRERERAIHRHYLPHRGAIEQVVGERIAAGSSVLHIAVHSFVPCLDGVVRDFEIGLLYDPSRDAERTLCRGWKASLRAELPKVRVRRNAPYRGVADGLTRALRERFPRGYAGIELELNQRLVQDRSGREELARRVFAALWSALA